MIGRQRLQCHASKRGQVTSIFQQFDEGFKAVKIDELLRNKRIAKLLRHYIGIALANMEGNYRADVSEDGLPDRQRKLVDVLMRQRQTQPVFSRFRQNRGKRLSGKILEFINKQEKILPLGLRLVRARHGRMLKLGEQQGTEEVGFVMADFSLGKIGDKQLFVVHGMSEFNLAFDLAKNISDNRI